MAGIDERDKILTKWMKEWDELGLDLIVTPASLMPAPLKVSFFHFIFLGYLLAFNNRIVSQQGFRMGFN